VPDRTLGNVQSEYVLIRVIHCRRILTLAGAVCLSAILLIGQEPRVNIEPRTRAEPAPPGSPGSAKSGSNIRVDVNEVTIPVTVTDIAGQPVTGLPAEAFQIYENGVQQLAVRLSHDDSPLSIGLVFDASGSMFYKLDKSREAVVQLLKTSMPGDEFFLVQFNDDAKLLTPFTSEQGEIESAMAGIRPIGWTALLDSLYLSLHQMKHARNTRRVLVVLSDGGDNNSRFTEHEVRALLRESDVSLYAIGMAGPLVDLKLLENLAEETGGHMFEIKNVWQLPEAMSKLSTALREQYNLTYSPANTARDGKYRHVQVKLTPPPGFPRLHLSWRNGYYAP
jgi:Ca-activated chloride channel family protein